MCGRGFRGNETGWRGGRSGGAERVGERELGVSGAQGRRCERRMEASRIVRVCRMVGPGRWMVM